MRRLIRGFLPNSTTFLSIPQRSALSVTSASSGVPSLSLFFERLSFLCLPLFCFHSSFSLSLFSGQCEQPLVHVSTFRTWKDGSDIGINSLLRTIRTQHFSQCGSKWLTTNRQLPLMSILFTHGGRAIVPNFLTPSNGRVTRNFSQVHAKYVSDGKLKYVD